MTPIRLPIFRDHAALVSTQDRTFLPFAIKRAYFIYNIKKNSVRGKHAHKKAKQALFCIQGSVSLCLDDGKNMHTHTVNNPRIGVFIDRMVWMKVYNASPDAILLVFASEYFKKNDYIRSYRLFRRLTQ